MEGGVSLHKLSSNFTVHANSLSVHEMQRQKCYFQLSHHPDKNRIMTMSSGSCVAPRDFRCVIALSQRRLQRLKMLDSSESSKHDVTSQELPDEAQHEKLTGKCESAGRAVVAMSP